MHRIREQKNLLLPTGVLDHMFSFPKQYGSAHCAISIQEEHLREVTDGLLDSVEQENNLRLQNECERLLPCPGDLEPHKVTESYLYLKQSLNL